MMKTLGQEPVQDETLPVVPWCWKEIIQMKEIWLLFPFPLQGCDEDFQKEKKNKKETQTQPTTKNSSCNWRYLTRFPGMHWNCNTCTGHHTAIPWHLTQPHQVEAAQQCQGEGHHIATGRSQRAESLQCQALSLGTLAPKSLWWCFAVQPLPGTPQICLASLTAAAKKILTRGCVALYLPKPSSPHLQTICKGSPFHLIKKTQDTILQTIKETEIKL